MFTFYLWAYAAPLTAYLLGFSALHFSWCRKLNMFSILIVFLLREERCPRANAWIYFETWQSLLSNLLIIFPRHPCLIVFSVSQELQKAVGHSQWMPMKFEGLFPLCLFQRPTWCINYVATPWTCNVVTASRPNDAASAVPHKTITTDLPRRNWLSQPVSTRTRFYSFNERLSTNSIKLQKRQ